jgi:hypothetical protein
MNPWDLPDGPGRLDSEPHRGNLVRILGQLSISCFPAFLYLSALAATARIGLAVGGFGLILGIVAWVLGAEDLARIRAGEMDRRGEAATRRGRNSGRAGACLNGSGLLVWGPLAGYLFQ